VLVKGGICLEEVLIALRRSLHGYYVVKMPGPRISGVTLLVALPLPGAFERAGPVHGSRSSSKRLSAVFLRTRSAVKTFPFATK
jgi:hypothetical protein